MRCYKDSYRSTKSCGSSLSSVQFHEKFLNNCLTTAGKTRQLLLNKIDIPFLPSLYSVTANTADIYFVLIWSKDKDPRPSFSMKTKKTQRTMHLHWSCTTKATELSKYATRAWESYSCWGDRQGYIGLRYIAPTWLRYIGTCIHQIKAKQTKVQHGKWD